MNNKDKFTISGGIAGFLAFILKFKKFMSKNKNIAGSKDNRIKALEAKMNKNIHFSSKTDNWATPQYLFDILNESFKFDIDVCASKENAKCERFFTKEDNGLLQKWSGNCFMNPPYGREIGKWVKKAYEESLSGNTIVCLLPARTDTKWFHDYCAHGTITFIKGRLKFGNSKNSAPFPSMTVVFKG